MSSNDILDLNNLIYVADSNASVALNKVQRIFYPEKSTYKSQERIAITIHGNQFLDFKNSSIRFLINYSGTIGNTVRFGTLTSATALFNRVRVVSKDGIVLTDLMNSNLFSFIDTKLKNSKLYEDIVGDSYGYENGGFVTIAATTQAEFTIPLRFLSPLFNSDQLLPPQISDGMTVELFLENPTIALDVSGGGAQPVDYSLDNVELLVDSSLVQDDTRNTVENMGFKANDDLVYEFVDVVDSISYAPIGTEKIYYEAPHSLTNALEAVTVLRKTVNINNFQASSLLTNGAKNKPYSNEDSMSYSLGSNKFPQQPAIGGARIYQQILHSQGVLQSTTCDNFNLPLDNPYVNPMQTHNGCYPVNLRTSKIFDNSGRTISNSQRLSVEIRRWELAGANETYQLNMFIYYTSRIVIKNGQMSIEI
jgi:hypothetical protein